MKSAERRTHTAPDPTAAISVGSLIISPHFAIDTGEYDAAGSQRPHRQTGGQEEPTYSSLLLTSPGLSAAPGSTPRPLLRSTSMLRVMRVV
jgi:hypothetical protein